MKYFIIVAVATAVILLSTACSGGNHSNPPIGQAVATSVASSVPGHDPTPEVTASTTVTSGDATSTGSGADSPFCTLAGHIGLADLGVSSGPLDPDPTTLLTQVDQLDALAPADLKQDFDVFTAFEHAVLEPGQGNAPQIKGDTTAALEHVSTYFTDTCAIS